MESNLKFVLIMQIKYLLRIYEVSNNLGDMLNLVEWKLLEYLERIP